MTDKQHEFEIGQRVFVDTLAMHQIEKVVYKINSDGPLLCSPEEWHAAQADGREPRGTGWPQENIHRC